MHLRRVSALTTVLALALTLGLTACASKVVGSPVAAAGGSTGEKTASGKPSSTKTTSKSPSKPSNKPSTSASAQTGSPKPAGDIKITTKKQTKDYEDCDLLTPEEVAAAVGAAKGGEKGCVQSTQDPVAVVLFMLSFAEYEGEARAIEVGGNTAYEVKEEGDCTVLVMLTDDPDVVTPAFMATVTPIDEFEPCAVALKLATKAFEKIPNAV